MKFIKKLLPRKLKSRLKAWLGIDSCHIDIMRIGEDIAARKMAQERATAEQRLAGRVAVVTGAGGFIGESITRRLIRLGAVVLACGRSVEKLQEIYKDIPKEQIDFFALELTDTASIAGACEKMAARHGKIDMLINCAGGSAREDWSYIYDQRDEVIEDVIGKNLTGTMLMIKHVARHMVAQKSGKIINIGSTVGVGGKAGFSDYAAAKAGIIGATKSLALELGVHSITVNCITPGIVNRSDFTAASLAHTLKTNALRSVGIAEDIAYAVDFFVSDEANFITGQNLIVDGGRSLGLKGD